MNLGGKRMLSVIRKAGACQIFRTGGGDAGKKQRFEGASAAHS